MNNSNDNITIPIKKGRLKEFERNGPRMIIVGVLVGMIIAGIILYTASVHGCMYFGWHVYYGVLLITFCLLIITYLEP